VSEEPETRVNFHTAGIVAGILAGVIFLVLLIWALIPHPKTEKLEVVGYRYELVSGFSYIVQDRGTCYVDEGNCPSALMTPIARNSEMYYPDELIVVGTVESTEIVEYTDTEYIQGSGEIECGSDDLQGVEVVAYCTPTPKAIEVEKTRVVRDVDEIVATATPYPREVVTYLKDRIVYDSVSSGVIQQRVATQQLVYPTLPANVTPQPQDNNQKFVVVMVNKDGKERVWITTVQDWYRYETGQIFPNAQVDQYGTVHALKIEKK
jgi:hypothetical protein